MIRNSNQNMLLAASSSSSTTAVPSSSTSTRTTQSSSTPSQCWNPTPTCSAGLSNIANNPSDLGGRYYDPAYSALWNVQCAQGSSNTAYFGSWTTNGQGPTVGGGRCYGYSDIGNYTASTLYYASANIIVPNTYFPCPTYNGATYTNPQDGSVWQIRCGVSLDPGTSWASTAEGMIVDMPSCLTACNGVAQCTAAWWQYNSNTEYKDVDPQARGNCYYRTGTVTYNANPSAAAALYIKLYVKLRDPFCSFFCSFAVSIYECNFKQYFLNLNSNIHLYWLNNAQQFARLTNANSGLGVLAMNVPPNPAYPVPVLAPGTNTSSGCGTPLPNGVTPDGASTTFTLAGPDGFTREYAIHIPKYYDTNRASPLIMAFPGNGDTAANIEPQTRMSNSELNPYGIAVYVTGVNRGFVSNPGWGVPGSANANVDDIGFIKKLVDYLTSNYCVDTGRIFATGHSNGGGFCNVMACDPVLSVTFAAFAPASGAFYTGATSGNPETVEPVNTPTQPQCSPGRNNVPMLEFHGTNDGTINYSGGPRNGRILPTLPHWSTAWSVRQGYGITNYTSNLPSLNSAMTVTKYEFGGDAGQLGIVTHYRLGGWTHNYPNVDTTSSAPVNGPQLAMDFFYRWTNPSRQSVYFPADVIRSSASSSMSSTSATASSSSSSSSSSSQATSTASSTDQASSSSITTASSSSASASATAIACPQANGTTVTVDGKDFVVQCGWDHAGGDISSQYVDSFYQCISICVKTPECVLVTLRANSCFLKSLVGEAIQGEVSGAILVSIMGPSSSSTSSASSTVSSTSTSRPAGAQFTAGSDSSVCPQYNNTAYTSPGGRTYTPYCGGFQAIGTGYVPQDTVASTFEDCMAQCDDTEDCNAVDYYVASSTCGLLIGGNITSTTRRNGYDAAILGEPSSPASSSTAGDMSMSETASLSTSMVTMSMSVSDSSSMPSETPPSTPNAPCANNTAVMSEDGTSYTLFCGYDTEGEEAFDTMTYEDGDWIQCEDFCDASDGCEVWVWQYQILGGGTCSVKRLPQTLRLVDAYDAQDYVVGFVSNAVPSASSSVAGPAPSTSMEMSTSEAAGGPSSYQDATASSTNSQMNGMTSSSTGMMTTSSSTSSPLIITDYYTPPSSEVLATTSRISSASVSMSSSMSMTMDQPQSSISSDAENPSGYMSDSMSMSMSTSMTMSMSIVQSESSTMSGTSSSSGPSNPPGYTSTPDAMSTSSTSSGMSSSQGASNPPAYSLTTDSAGIVVSSSMTSSSGASNPAGYTSSPGVIGVSSTSSSDVPPPEYSQTSPGSTASGSGAMTPNPSSPITSSATPVAAEDSEACSMAKADGTECIDSYGNSFTVSSGTKYRGSVRAVNHARSFDECLAFCDALGSDCEAANFDSASGDCELLDDVTGIEIVSGADANGALAASRAADAGTIYTTPRSTTTGMTSPGTYASATTTAASTSTSPSNYQTGPGPVPSASLTNVGPIATSSSAAPPVSTGAVSDDGTCGPENEDKTCQGSGFGDCCSEYGFCGSTDFYCDTGCLVGYGKCNNAPVQSNSVSTSPSQGGSSSGGSNSPTTTTTRINSVSVIPLPGSSATGSQSAGASSSGAVSNPESYSGSQPANPTSPIAPTSSTPGSNPSGYPGNGSTTSPPPQSLEPSSASTSGTAPPPSSTPPICPTYDTRSYQDPPTDISYNISCGTSYTGTTITPQLYRRQQAYSEDVTAQECITTCSDIPGCIAITFVPFPTSSSSSGVGQEGQGECTLFSSLTGISYEPDAVSALKLDVSGEGGGGVVGVVTVTASVYDDDV
ncbi:putative ferulic acid esterase [Hortaea werneckii]|nr:putative ferulic acid esterase [Hortaea werneckii]KAI7308892.1 putative ferulic acid esterase [Hortaea werneckii]